MTTKSHMLAQRLSAGGTFTATITKRTGITRQIRFRTNRSQRIQFAGPDNSARMFVYDLDASQYRTLRLDAIHQLTQAPKPERTFEEMQALTDSLF